MNKRIGGLFGVTILIAVGIVIAGAWPDQSGCCDTAEELRSLILDEVPELQQAKGLDRAELLLGWAANTSDIARDQETLRRDTESMLPHQVYSKVFAADAGGVFCGGASTYYRSILHLFQIDAFTINFGTLQDNLTHVSVVVPYEGKYYLFDPTFGAVFRRGEEFVSIQQLLEGDLNGVVFRELSMANRDFLTTDPRPNFCRTAPTKVGKFVKCGIGETSYVEFYLDNWKRRLHDAGIPVGIETIPALMRRGFFSVGPAMDPAETQGFIRLLSRYEIPMSEQG